MTGFAPAFGLATAMDTLCSQAFGANNKKLLGVILQRGLALELALCVPILIIWAFSKQFLLAVGQDAEVVGNTEVFFSGGDGAVLDGMTFSFATELSSTYVWIMMVGLYPLAVYELLKKYLQAQHIVLPQMFVAIAANVWNVFANWFFVYGIGLGFIGAPIARASTNCLLPVLTVLYMKIKMKKSETWGGFSKEALSKWKEFLFLGFPGMIMVCLEFWAFECGAIMAGIMGTTELAAQSVCHLLLAFLRAFFLMLFFFFFFFFFLSSHLDHSEYLYADLFRPFCLLCGH